MTRLADALERAEARRSATLAQEDAVGTADAASPAVTPPTILASPAARRTPVPDPLVRQAPLLVSPRTLDDSTAWRTDPDNMGKLVSTDGFSSAALEQYRKLAASLHYAQSERGLKVIIAASALPDEGKSLTVINTALTLAESYQRRVVLIDADLRRPSIARHFGISPLNGLSDMLKAERDPQVGLVRISERLHVVPAGRPDPDPIRGLTSDVMKRLIAQASAAYDWVIIDTPPVTLLPDANLITSIAGGVLLVVRCGKAPLSLVRRTIDGLGHERIVGVIMNAVDFAHDRNAGGYYHYYGAGYYGTPTTK